MTKLYLPGIRHVLAVASGKGGVGKTTVTVNLALALQQQGARVGVFDADTYGPNVPLMLGVHRTKAGSGYVPIVRAKGAPAYLRPLPRFGLKVISMGLLMAEDQVINPPGGAVGQLVVQTLRDVIWGELDYLLIDLPPSAGQPQEDLLHKVALAGVVIVTTPQDLSLLDASRSLQMFRQAGVRILGVVENMSYFICPNCRERHEIFRHSQRGRPVALNQAPLLGRIPLAADISRRITPSDPLVNGRPDTVQAQAFLEVAGNLATLLEPNSGQQP
jgi:ATP-binding protein involved in chromosome partitioning